MIHRIYSSLPTFKELKFGPGLNVVLAEKSKEASERQTRNRAGKSSITEIIHFLMAGNIEKGSIFKDEALCEQAFGLEFDLGNNPIQVERTPKARGNLRVVSGDTENWPIQPSVDKKTEELVISNAHWKFLLGKLMFGLDETVGPKGPTFRTMFSHLLRRHSNGGFQKVFRNGSDQTPGNAQVNISYLLDLDWSVPQDWEYVREKENILKTLKKAAKTGTFGAIVSTTSDLRTELTVAEAKAIRLRASLAEFKILDEYRGLEQEASKLSIEIGGLSNNNFLDRQLITDLDKSLASEEAPPPSHLEEVYREAGIALPGLALQRLDDVRAFHESVIANRRSYLEGEVGAGQKRIDDREAAIRRLEERRSQIMGILRAHGALDHYSKLQAELARVEADVENLKQRHAVAEKLETGKIDLEFERQHLLRRLREDHEEQSEVLDLAILTFEEFSNSLYEDAGSLVIGKGLNGPEFDIKIHGKRSAGISNMQIFCFDMMLMKLCAARGIGPGFLFHDSHLFDGVDERQVARALQIAAKTAEEVKFQYIVAMNDDAIPVSLPKEFGFNERVISAHLTDAKTDGGLFGIRFA